MKSALFLLFLLSPKAYAGPVKCLAGFVQIEGRQNNELRSFLEANVDCLDSANYDNQNYQTFSLARGNIDALLIALTVRNDAKQLSRIYQPDATSESAHSYLLTHPEGQKETIERLYAAGLRKQTGPKGENLSDLAWKTDSGEVAADLFIQYGVKASGKDDKYEYIVSAAIEGFTSFVVSYFKKTGLDLQKKYLYPYSSSRPQTLLMISLQAQTDGHPFSLDIVDYYIERGEIISAYGIDRDFLTALVRLRNSLKEFDKIKRVDEVHLKIARSFPTQWSQLIDSSYTYGGIEDLLKSILSRKTVEINLALDAIFPLQNNPSVGSAAGWALLNSQENDFSQVRDFLVSKNRFPLLNQLAMFIYYNETYRTTPVIAEAAFKVYFLGTQSHLYPLPSCNTFFTKESVVFDIRQAQDLFSLGMDKKSCVDVVKILPPWGDYYDNVFFFYEISGVEQPKVLTQAMNYSFGTKNPIVAKRIFSLGYRATAEQFLQAMMESHESIAAVFASHLDQMEDTFVREHGCKILQFTAKEYARDSIEQILPTFLVRDASLGKTCSSLLVHAAGKLALDSVDKLLKDGANVNEQSLVESYFAFNYDQDNGLPDKKVKWTATPLIALSSYLFRRSPADWTTVNSIAKLLIAAGANPNLYVLLPINEFVNIDYNDRLYFGLSTTALGSAILSGDIEYVKFLTDAVKVEIPSKSEVFASRDQNFQTVDFRLSLSTPQSLQYIGALSTELKIIRANYNRFKDEEYMEPYFEMLKYLVKIYGVDTGKYSIFPFRGEVMCPPHNSNCKTLPRAQIIFETTGPISILKWLAMRFNPTHSSICAFYSNAFQSNRLREAINDYVSFIKLRGGDIQEFSKPSLEAIFFWRLANGYLKCGN